MKVSVGIISGAAFLASVAFSAFVFGGGSRSISSGGAPVSSTGAPGEQTCAQVGCHDDALVNSQNGQPELLISGIGEGYEAGKTYRLTVALSHTTFNKRFGFQLVALDAQNKNAGSFRLCAEDEERTQIIRNPNVLTDREYITYTYPGTEATTEGKGYWIVDWTAPKDYQGPISFYGATVAANNDNTDKGDEVFTFSRTVPPLKAVTKVTGDNEHHVRLSLYPNPAQQELSITLPQTIQGVTRLRISNLRGEVVQEFVPTASALSSATIRCDIHSLATGYYQLYLFSANGTHTSATFIKE